MRTEEVVDGINVWAVNGDGSGCTRCVFRDREDCNDMACLSIERHDKQNVYFTKRTKTNTIRPKNFHKLVQKEIERSMELHPDYPDCNFKRLAIISEEFGEVAKSVNDLDDGKDTAEHLKEELIQTAAMCMKMWRSL